MMGLFSELLDSVDRRYDPSEDESCDDRIDFPHTFFCDIFFIGMGFFLEKHEKIGEVSNL